MRVIEICGKKVIVDENDVQGLIEILKEQGAIDQEILEILQTKYNSMQQEKEDLETEVQELNVADIDDELLMQIRDYQGTMEQLLTRLKKLEMRVEVELNIEVKAAVTDMERIIRNLVERYEVHR